MKFTTAIFTIGSLLATSTLAAPAAQSEAAVGHVASDAEQIEALFADIVVEEEGEDGDNQSPASPLVPRGNNYCSPTGAESCNFWIKTTIPIASSGYQRWWGLYSHTCAKIGGETQSLSPASESWSLTSQLPYTIELTINTGGFRPGGHFWYAGRKTSLGNAMYCEDCSGLTASNCCRVAFRCR
ncbi:unnamed protein product [Parascedosporium putredinis]|uniref:Uncharacterized protein n=1 Tax=Parascedosporium putredinis TaxID=1442378 RepID=A0A9P1M8Z1_9PEZI|nr:unnamed protein product [Parascedosporium putredinis]CAI7994737.1 unnamed protein product [Parascedosporium putredinis]